MKKKHEKIRWPSICSALITHEKCFLSNSANNNIWGPQDRYFEVIVPLPQKSLYCLRIIAQSPLFAMFLFFTKINILYFTSVSSMPLSFVSSNQFLAGCLEYKTLNKPYALNLYFTIPHKM